MSARDQQGVKGGGSYSTAWCEIQRDKRKTHIQFIEINYFCIYFF